MKKLFVMALLALVSASALADVPVIIGLPSKAWMKKYEYGTNEQLPNGRTKFNPDYVMALEDTKFGLTAVLRAVSKPFEEYYKVEDLQQTLNNVDEDADLFEEYGADLDMSEQIAVAAKPDVMLQIQYVEDEPARMGPRTRYNVEVSAIDAYTNDVITTFSDVTALESAAPDQQIKKLVSNHMQELLGAVNKSFEETVKYGRECRVTCLVKGVSFNSDQANGQVLKYYVRDVMKGIANEGRSTNKRDTDKMQDYRIRIGVGQKVEDLGEILQNKFANAGYPVRVDKKGLGKFVIIFGE